MCMKNINATTEMYASVKNSNNVLSFTVPFNTIRATIKNNEFYISNFFIVTSFTLLGTNKKPDIETNIVEQKKKLFCLIRLTKISDDNEKRISWDIDKFDINTADKSIRFEGACVSSVSYRKITNVYKIKLDDDYRGDYALKVLIKENANDKWTVQSISRLTVI